MSTGLRNVIISGFYDSIGLYTSTDTEKAIADEWLALLGMSTEPTSLQSALVRRPAPRADRPGDGEAPALLILDEPASVSTT